MDVIFYILFLLESFAILLAISRKSNAKTASQMESYFRKISKYGGEYADILESLLPLTRKRYVTLCLTMHYITVTLKYEFSLCMLG